MADIGLALGDAIPKIINMRSSIADLQERAKRMRMEEELHLPRKQALEGSVEAQNIANETNLLALNEAKKNAERRNQPVDLNKLDWTDPFVHITAQVGQRTGRWGVAGNNIPIRGQIEDIQKEIITNPQLYVKDFQDQFTAIQTSKEYTALKREAEIVKANISEQKKIINTSTNIKEIQKAKEEIEKINEASSGTKEQLDVIEAKRSKLLKAISTFDTSIEIKQIFEDNKELFANLSPELQQRLQIMARLGDKEGIRKALEEHSKVNEGKIPIQSDKLQGAMAELGMDITNPKTYKDPGNIARASAHLRNQEAEIRQERGEELNKFQRANIAHQLRTEIRQDKYVQDFKDVTNKYQVMEIALKKAGTNPKSMVAIDQALITLYNKMTDPQSVVRESEYARTPENMSVVNRVIGKLDKWRAGGAGLTPDERIALVEMGKEFYNKYAENYDQIISDYKQTAKETGIDPRLIGIPYERKNIPQKQSMGQTTTNLGGQVYNPKTKRFE